MNDSILWRTAVVLKAGFTKSPVLLSKNYILFPIFMCVFVLIESAHVFNGTANLSNGMTLVRV